MIMTEAQKREVIDLIKKSWDGCKSKPGVIVKNWLIKNNIELTDEEDYALWDQAQEEYLEEVM
jgi:hypothetical protein